MPRRPGPAGFHTALAMHFHCRGIRRGDDPFVREVGFNCTCGGQERQWNVPLTDLRHYDRSIIAALEMLRNAHHEDNWAARREVNVEDFARMGIDIARNVDRWRVHEARLEKDKVKARKKARVLLQRHVTQEQWEEFRKRKFFHIVGSDGRRYRIHHQIGSNVTLIVDGVDVARYCLVPKGHEWIPEPDMMLAVKLMLETNARSFLRRANKMELRRAG